MKITDKKTGKQLSSSKTKEVLNASIHPGDSRFMTKDEYAEFVSVLNTQNTRATECPFMVMDKKKIPTDSEYSDDYVWYSLDTGEHVESQWRCPRFNKLMNMIKTGS